MGKIFCVQFQRHPLKFHKKIFYQYIARCVVCWEVKKLTDLRGRKRFLNAPPGKISLIDIHKDTGVIYQLGFSTKMAEVCTI